MVALKGADAVIIDAKTGKPSPAHAVQVAIYQYAVPKALDQYRGMEFRGHVAFPNGNVGLPVSAVDEWFVESLGALIRWLASETPARRVPSAADRAMPEGLKSILRT